ncbi:MAG: deoxynucleoside kinase [candidate division Zixibacteria bacterium]|nr:deoxynucleoside kinase [candidate division Zixibacteria bacterium]
MAELNYMVIEGAIGAGKTSLAQLLAERFGASLVLEEVEKNPFLMDFYKDRKRFAFQTQVYFLLSRFKQQQELLERDLFKSRMISDYLFWKDRVFASITLSERELYLYEKMLPILEKNIPKPDLVIYLQSSPEVLHKRIKEKGRDFEKSLDSEYLSHLVESYNHFFFHYNLSPLLVVKNDNLDFQRKPDQLEDLINIIKEQKEGTRYYVPAVEG